MRKKQDKKTLIISATICFFSLSILAFMVWFVFKESLGAIGEVGFKGLLFSSRWQPINTSIHHYGIRNMLLSTLYVSALGVFFAFVVGIGCALFLAIDQTKRKRELLLPAINLLAGIPSVVYGFVGLAVVVRAFEKFGMASGESVLAGAIVLSVMLLPYVISSSCETMVKIKNKYLLSSEALGVSKWFLASKVVLPKSLKGILVSIILATGRAMGETMAVMMVMGNAPAFPHLLGKGETLSSLIALEMGAAEVGSTHFSALYFAGLTLLFLLLLINVIFFFLDKILLEDR